MAGDYEKEASDRSKALIVYFLLVSVGLAIFSDMKFGLWWFLIVPAGIFLVSIAGGVWQALCALIFRQTPLNSLNSLPVLVGHLLIGTLGSYYALRAVHKWIH